MALQGILLDSYRKTGTGRKVWRFSVKGAAKEIERYKEVQGDNYREDSETGLPLFFLPAVDPQGNVVPIDNVINIVITGGDNPRAVMSSTRAEVEAIRAAKLLVPQELAKQMAASMFGGGSVRQTVSTPTANRTTSEQHITEEETVDELEGGETLES